MHDHAPLWETSIALMAKIGACWSPSFSPDGTHLAFISNLTGLPQVWTVATEGGWPYLVTALDDQISSVAWSPRGDWLAFALAPGGGLNQQIYLIRPDGTGLRRLTAGGTDNNWLGPWSHDGQFLAIASSQRSADALDAYVADVTSGDQRLVTENQGIGRFTDISRDGQRAVLYRMVSRSDDNLVLVNLASGHEVLLTPHTGPGSFHAGRFSPDGHTIYLASNQDRELIAFARIQIGADAQPGPIEVVAERDDAELQAFEITDDGETAVLLWNVAGRHQLAFLNLSTLERTPGPELPMDIVFGMTFSPNGRLLALSTSGATAPRDIWVYDRAAERLWQVRIVRMLGLIWRRWCGQNWYGSQRTMGWNSAAGCISPTASAHPAL